MSKFQCMNGKKNGEIAEISLFIQLHILECQGLRQDQAQNFFAGGQGGRWVPDDANFICKGGSFPCDLGG